MGPASRQPVHARHRRATDRAADHRAAAPRRAGRRRRAAAGLIAALLLATPLAAETLRVATFNTELGRRGPGLLLADLLSEDEDTAAVVRVIAAVRPDVVVLQGIDYDLDGAALGALSDALSSAGHAMPHRFAARPNSGWRTGRDHDGDGRSDGPRDAQGYGRFPGQGGMAVLSRHPIDEPGVRDFSAMLWADLPGATLPQQDGHPFPDAALYEVQRLSSVAHWDVPVNVGGTQVHLLAFHATPPVFDGPEDMNGLRNRDELRLWPLYLDGALPGPPPPRSRYIVLGDANLDPVDGEGDGAAMAALLAGPWVRDAKPRSEGALAAADPGQAGDPALDTVDWPDGAPGNLRVDYVLPSPDLRVTGAGVYWPAPGQAGAATAEAASRHRLVWVDVLVER